MTGFYNRDGVHCAVRVESLNTIQVSFQKLGGPAMSQEVSRRPVIAAGLVRSQMIPCEICDGRSGRGPGFVHSTSVSPCQITPPTLHTHFHMHAALARRKNG
jgi:hypothetical protein